MSFSDSVNYALSEYKNI